MSNTAMGIAGVTASAIFWGSNFIVCKGYELPDDGMHFVFLMATGILLVGICTLFASELENGDFEVVLAPDGLLGGGIWAMGNFLTVPIIKNVGIGLGLAIWGGVNLVVAFVVGVVGMGSLLEKETLANPSMGIAAIVVAVLALLCFSRIKPTLEKENEEGTEALNNTDVEEQKPAQGSVVLGISLAVLSGVCYGFQFVPLTIWNNKINENDMIFDHPKPSDTVTSIRFFFSQYVGIYLVSLIGFVIYIIYTGNKPKLVPNHAIFPCICSGIVWSLGCGGGMFATAGLGNAVGFPLVINCSFLVNSSWSIFYFKEIQGHTNLRYFGAAFLLNIASSVLISLSKGT